MAELVEIDISEWQKKMAFLSAATNRGMREVLYEEWPLLLEKIMDFTPPFKTAGGTGSSNLSVGRAAVARDIQRTMRPFDPASIRSKGIAKIVAKKDLTAFNAVTANIKSGPLKGARGVAFSPSVHTSLRAYRGRVGRDTNQRVIGTDAGLLKKYIRSVQDMVGFAKSGWLAAYYLVGGSRAPGYVTKHGTGGGGFIDNHADEEDPSITAINRTPWAERRDEGSRIVQAAYNSRAQAIFSKAKTKLRMAIKEAGLAA